MKKNNLWRIIWIVGIYAILVSILYLIVVYKVKWEDRDLSKYLYFYNCSNELCTSYSEPLNYYSSVKCENDICPFIIEKKDNILILGSYQKNWLYNYIDGMVINDNYLKYKFTNSDYYIVTNENNLQGVIDRSGNVVIDFKYDEIIDFKNDFIVYKKDNKYGIDNIDGSISIDPIYDSLVLINSELYGYLDDDMYYMAYYNTKTPVSDTTYDYIYSVDDVILTVRNNQIDILGANLNTKLLMKINSYYSYTTEKERATLNIYVKDNMLYFSVFTNDDNTKYINYVFNIKTGKLYN